MTDYVLTPSPDVEVSALSSFNISFPEAKFLGLYGSSLIGVTLTREDDPSVVYVPVNSVYHTTNNQTFSIKPKGAAGNEAVVITEPGRYVLHIPAATFDLCGSWYAHLDYNPEINAVYTVSDDGGSGFDSYFDTDYIGIRPLPGTVTDVDEVTLSFPMSDIYATLHNPDLTLISIRRIDDDRKYQLCNCEIDYGGTATLRFRPADARYDISEPLYEPGEYVIDIPAGVFRQSLPMTVNPHLEIHYKVGSPLTASFANPVITPTPGTVDQISEMTIEFPELTNSLNLPDDTDLPEAMLNGSVTLTRLSNADNPTTYIPYSVKKLSDNKVAMQFKTRVQTSPTPRPVNIDTKGDYRLEIASNTFKELGSQFSFNQRIIADYTVDRDAVANTMANHYFTPADGSTVTAIDQVTLTFPDLPDGLVWPFPKENITMHRRDNPDERYKITNVMVHGNTILWRFSYPEIIYGESLVITTDGVYDITVAAGTFTDYANQQITNDELHYTLTVDNSMHFRSSLAPADDRTLGTLDSITLTAGDDCIFIDTDATIPAPAFSNGTSIIAATPSRIDDRHIIFRPSKPLSAGSWHISFAAGYLSETRTDGTVITNSTPFELNYSIAAPSVYSVRISPADGSELTGFSTITITAVGDNLKSVDITDGIADTPCLIAGDTRYPLTIHINENAIVLEPAEPFDAIPGKYTLYLPDGLITLTDIYSRTSPLPHVAALYTVTSPDLPEMQSGIFFLNEGWFGTDHGSINYLDTDYTTMSYRVYAAANLGLTLGVTSQYADIFANRFYILSKNVSNSDTRGLLTVADASTMNRIADVVLPFEARSLCGVTPDKLYIGTASGIYTFNTSDNSIGTLIEGTGSDTGVYSDQTGDMVRHGRRVFAAWQGHGLIVIDTRTDHVEGIIPITDIVSVIVTAEGDVVAATSSAEQPFLIIDTEQCIATPVDTRSLPVASSWSSWRKAPLAASVSGCRLYYLTSDRANAVASVNLADGEFKPDFVTLPSGMTTYGTALSTDPATDMIVIQAVGEGYGEAFSHNAIYFADPERGGAADRYSPFFPTDNYWFPAMAVYPIESKPEVHASTSLKINLDDEDTSIDIASMTLLGTGNRHSIVYDATTESSDICTVTPSEPYGTFVISPLRAGETTLTLTADYRGIIDSATLNLTITATDGLNTITPPTPYPTPTSIQSTDAL